MPKVSVAASLALLVSLLPGCSAITDKVGEATVEGTSRVGKALGNGAGDEPDPKQSLRAAIQEVRGESIDYTFSMLAVDVDLQETDGTFYPAPARWAATTSFTEWTDRSSTHSMETTSVDGSYFVRSADWLGGQSDCWLIVDPKRMASSGVVAMEPGTPLPILVLDHLRPSPLSKPTTSGLMTARLPLRQALEVLPPWLEKRLKIRNRRAINDLWAEVVLEVADGRLASVTFTRSTLTSQLEINGMISHSAALLLAKVSFKVTYPLDAESRPADPPEDDLVMTQEDVAAGRDCHASEAA